MCLIGDAGRNWTAAAYVPAALARGVVAGPRPDPISRPGENKLQAIAGIGAGRGERDTAERAHARNVTAQSWHVFLPRVSPLGGVGASTAQSMVRGVDRGARGFFSSTQ